MPRFQKRPVIVTAQQFFQDEFDATQALPPGGCDCQAIQGGVHVHTLEGVYPLRHTDWVAQGIRGESSPMRDDLFEETYERLEDM